MMLTNSFGTKSAEIRGGVQKNSLFLNNSINVDHAKSSSVEKQIINGFVNNVDDNNKLVEMLFGSPKMGYYSISRYDGSVDQVSHKNAILGLKKIGAYCGKNSKNNKMRIYANQVIGAKIEYEKAIVNKNSSAKKSAEAKLIRSTAKYLVEYNNSIENSKPVMLN